MCRKNAKACAGRTMEWNTAAGHAVLLAAAGSVETGDGEPSLYRQEGPSRTPPSSPATAASEAPSAPPPADMGILTKAWEF